MHLILLHFINLAVAQIQRPSCSRGTVRALPIHVRCEVCEAERRHHAHTDAVLSFCKRPGRDMKMVSGTARDDTWE